MVPGAHAEQLEAPAPAKLPSGQRVHALCPLCEKLPGEQEMQAALALSG